MPLYLLKIEIVPARGRLAAELVVCRVDVSRAAARGLGTGPRELGRRPRHWIFRWASRLAMLPVVFVYVVLVYFTQYLSWYGVWSLYEQHAFLVPAPFLGL